MSHLSTQRACELDPMSQQHRWLIEGLWTDQAVGVIGGEPKCFKSFLALDLAVAVASGGECLSRYPTEQNGPVLLFPGEDALHIVRQRIEGIARARHVPFQGLEVHVITEPSLRIDLEVQRQRLRQAVDRLRPRLLILDPFVRTHRADENVVAEVAPLLAYLRELQRQFQVAVLLVHHARKAHHTRPGQALRGSTELHAWLDSALYLRRKNDRVQLTIEHRSAPEPSPLLLQLDDDQGAAALRVVEHIHEQPEPSRGMVSPRDRILQALASAPVPMTQRTLRDAARMRAATVGNILADLIAEGRVTEDAGGYRLSVRMA